MITTAQLSPGDTLLHTLRHGLTELNKDKRVGGQIDVPLIEQGRRQAEVARQMFEGTNFDIVISSPLQRAIDTASIVTGMSSSDIEIEPLCTERSFGQMDGLTREEVEERFPQIVYLQIGHVGYSLNPPGGESFDELRRRAENFFDSLMRRHAGKSIVVSSHQNFLQQLHGLLLGRDPFDSLRSDLLNLELNQFHLMSEGTLQSHQNFHLDPNAHKHASF